MSKVALIEFMKTSQVFLKNRSRKNRIFQIIIILFVFLFFLYSLDDYIACHSTKYCDLFRPVSTDIWKATLIVKYDKALQDIHAHRFADAEERLEYIVYNDPGYPGAAEKLKELQNKQPEPSCIQTVSPISSVKITSTPNPTRTPITTSTISTSFTKYSTKEPLLHYFGGGGFGIFSDFKITTSTNLVLYSDGQLIIARNPYRFKQLSKGEESSLLSNLDKLGFYSIQTNNKHDETDPIYDFAKNYSEAWDGLSTCLSVLGTIEKSLCYYQPYKDFLIPKMKDLFHFMDDYEPENMMPYQADRIILIIDEGWTGTFPEDRKKIPWPSDLLSLESFAGGKVYIEGPLASKIFNFFNNSSGFFDLVDKGTEYSVFIQPVLPHENLIMTERDDRPVYTIITK